ncbi:hypothetical protein DES39_0587 [Orbus hercynius]|uniref:Uncharacterized protein n=1 Tax=Orbus hercynius TaxID=593135 RepID=A0A495RIJ3_9GAMM|nr:hypothetical protein [Orbus hercynius]RKS87363.1 hypothetical protein DES39_0587 [Orbus hercynius]
MKNIIMLVSLITTTFALVACGGPKQDPQDVRWSKPQRVLEGCDGAMSNSQQCQKNPNAQQMMIQIDKN